MTAILSLTSTDLQAQARISSVSTSYNSGSMDSETQYWLIVILLCLCFNVFAIFCIPFVKRENPQSQHLLSRTPEVTITVDHSRKTVSCQKTGPLANQSSINTYAVSEVQKFASGIQNDSPCSVYAHVDWPPIRCSGIYASISS
ncbi:hypothetical protein GEMRC1_000600 [Eukaryota sp. GEM-RC1]